MEQIPGWKIDLSIWNSEEFTEMGRKLNASFGMPESTVMELKQTKEGRFRIADYVRMAGMIIEMSPRPELVEFGRDVVKNALETILSKEELNEYAHIRLEQSTKEEPP